MSEPDLLQQAIDALNTGDRTGAARLLAQVVSQDPHDETAWLWLAACLDNVEKKRYCLQKALELNPANEAARQDLARLAAVPVATNAIQEDIHLPVTLEPVPVAAQASSKNTPSTKQAAKPTREPTRGVEIAVMVVLIIVIIAVVAAIGYMVFTNQFSFSGLINNLFK